MTQRELEAAFPKGADIDCVVKKVEPFGAFVTVEDFPDVTGLIRPREWSWSRQEFHQPQVASSGERIKARVIGHRKTNLELSRRLTLPNPYPLFKGTHRVGDVVKGQVEFIFHQEAGVRMILEFGVEGFIPRSELPDFAVRREGFGLLAQDWVEARILRFERSEVILSVKELLRAREQERGSKEDDRSLLRYHPTVGIVLEDLSLTLQIQEMPDPEIHPDLKKKIRRILVVEDNVGVSESLEMVLGHLGFTCDLADSVESARRCLQEYAYDLLILDINLPGEKGLALLREVHELGSPLWVFALTAAPDRDWSELIGAEARRIAAVFQKPTSAQRILEHLTYLLVRGPISHDDRGQPTGFSAEAFAHESLVGIRELANSSRRSLIGEHLERLKEETHATFAFALSYRPGPLYELVAGSFVMLTREGQQNLDISPVENVIRRRVFIDVADISTKRNWFQHLFQVYPLRSFAGCALDYTDQAEYGLFLIGDKPGQLRNISEGRLRQVATLIGHLLAEERFDHVVTENQGLLLTGFLADSILHEIKNAVQAVDSFSMIQTRLAKRYATSFTSISEREIIEFKKATLGIQSVTSQMKDLIHLFRNLASHSQIEEVDLNETIQRLVATVRPLADDRDVVVCEPRLADDLPLLRLRSKLLDQALLNLMINAIEQMEAGGVTRRSLRVSTVYQPDSLYPALISITDTGPGIHTVHRKRIFDLFFTTKERGTGLGLYISRLFVEQFGGRLRIQESFLLSGTTFLIELPREILV
ncbi:MAG TPA: ATP-binding protein [Thermoanaerobaculia bacterium]|nr:ATP-binding protein [Thermoanaerobaculia bacterium]